MIAFIVVTILALAALVFLLTTLRFQASAAGRLPGKKAPPFNLGAYLRWLGKHIRTIFSAAFFRRTWSIWNGWGEARYPGWLKWVFLVFAAAFAYLAASGLFFAVFIRRGLYGLPLLAHIASGGLFAVGLAAIMFLRARDYRFDVHPPTAGVSFAVPLFKTVSADVIRKALFWMFATLGLVQVSTALCSMLPVFTFNTQVALLMIHRWSALGLTLTALLFFDLALLGRPKTPEA